MFKKLTLCVVRVGATGDFRDSAPCIDCAATLKEFQIKRIIYSNAEGNLVTCKMCNYEATHVTTGRRHMTQ